MSLRNLWPNGGLRDVLRSGGRLTAKTVSIALGLLLLAVSVAFASSTNPIVFVALGTFLSFYLLKSILPSEALDEWTDQLMTGKLGERYYDRIVEWLNAINPWGGR